MGIESSLLSLTTAGSSMNPALAMYQHLGWARRNLMLPKRAAALAHLLPSIPGGNAGGVTLSKFSLHITGSEQGGEHEGAGCSVALNCDRL